MFNTGLNIFPADDGNKYVSVVDKVRRILFLYGNLKNCGGLLTPRI